MGAQAAHLVDCILPEAPLRQYVLSFPFELSALAATKPDVLTALCRLHAEALAHHYRAWAKSAGYKKAHPGAVSFVQCSEVRREGSRRDSPRCTHVHGAGCRLWFRT